MTGSPKVARWSEQTHPWPSVCACDGARCRRRSRPTSRVPPEGTRQGLPPWAVSAPRQRNFRAPLGRRPHRSHSALPHHRRPQQHASRTMTRFSWTLGSRGIGLSDRPRPGQVRRGPECAIRRCSKQNNRPRNPFSTEAVSPAEFARGPGDATSGKRRGALCQSPSRNKVPQSDPRH